MPDETKLVPMTEGRLVWLSNEWRETIDRVFGTSPDALNTPLRQAVAAWDAAAPDSTVAVIEALDELGGVMGGASCVLNALGVPVEAKP